MSFINQTLRSFLAIGAIAWQVGCSSGGVAVPDVPASVAQADFCSLYNQITCAASLGCCKDGNVVYASQDECLKQVSCPEEIQSIFQSSLLTSGQVTYDPAAASDYLRGMAAFAKACGATTSPGTGYPFIRGTRGSGESCSPQSDDSTNAFSCGPGLSCSLTPNMGSLPTGVCTPASASTNTSGEFGAACASSEDCLSGACEGGACAVNLKNTFCTAPPAQTTPSNGSLSFCPENVDIYYDNNDGGGSLNDLTITVYSRKCSYPRQCTTNPGGLSGGTFTRCEFADVTSSSTTFSTLIDLKLSGSDGLKVDKINLFNTSSAGFVTYTWDVSNFSNKLNCNCHGWDVTGWDYCWLDKSGNGSKNRMQLDVSNGANDARCYYSQ